MNQIDRAMARAAKALLDEKFSSVIQILNNFAMDNNKPCRIVKDDNDCWFVTPDSFKTRQEYVTYEAAIHEFLRILIKND